MNLLVHVLTVIPFSDLINCYFNGILVLNDRPVNGIAKCFLRPPILIIYDKA